MLWNGCIRAATAICIDRPAIHFGIHFSPEKLRVRIRPISKLIAKNRFANIQRPERSRQMMVVHDINALARTKHMRDRLFTQTLVALSG
jgi:hypothetical protein